jgi:hypothetical protein
METQFIIQRICSFKIPTTPSILINNVKYYDTKLWNMTQLIICYYSIENHIKYRLIKIWKDLQSPSRNQREYHKKII